MTIPKPLSLAVAIVLSSAGASQAVTAFDITVTGTSTMTATQQQAFSDAETYWESEILSYALEPPVLDSGLTINASITSIDGVGSILGQAGWTDASYVTNGGTTYAYSTAGVMQFDSADTSSWDATKWYNVILHEMAHVIGFGTLWTYNNVYVDDSGQYTGAAALAAYQAEFDATATYVPVELDGGSGTANGHWDEGWAGGIYDLMTGYLDSPITVSNTTIQSFADIGYIVAPTPVPLPASGLLLIGAMGGLVATRRRRAA